MDERPPTADIAPSPPDPGRAPAGDAMSVRSDSGGRPPTPAELHALNAALAREFPVAMDATELVLMDVDPTRLHAFWSIMPEDLQAVRQRLGQPSPAMVLRLHDVTPARFGHVDRAPPVDVDAEGLQGSRYVDRLEPGRSYSAELGLLGPDGALAVLAASNTLLMPGIAPPLAAPTPVAVPAELSEPPAEGPHDVPPGVRLAHLRPVFPNPGDQEPWRSVTLELRRSASDAPSTPQAEHGAAHAEDIGPTGTVPSSDSWQAPPGWSGSAPFAGGWSAFGNYSSGTLARPDTDLEMTVELLIRGRARPGASLSLFGQPVALGPDGSFALQKRLPDDVIPLVLALGRDTPSNDGGS